MTVTNIIDGILERKNDLKMTVQQISDASGVPKSTVDNILRKSVTNPSMQNVLDIAAAVGYDIGGEEDKTLEAITDPYVRYIIISNKRHTDALVAQSNAHNKSLMRIITILCVALIILLLLFLAVIGGIAWVIHYDLTHLDRGWIQAINNGYHTTAVDALLSVADWIGKIWA